MSGLWVYICCGWVAFGGFLFGWDSSYINGVMSMPWFIKDYGHVVDHQSSSSYAVVDGVQYEISSVNRSLITSLLSIGTLAGALLGGFICDWIGRKRTLSVGAAVYLVGVVLQISPIHIAGLIVGRIIAGFGVGLLSLVNPMYISEVIPPRVRGAMVGTYQLFITMGILTSQGASLGQEKVTNASAYRIPIGLQFIWGVIIFIGGFVITESPRWLVKQERYEESKVALGKVRNLSPSDPAVVAEFEEIKSTHEYELSLGTPSYAELFKGTLAPRTWVGINVQMFQQLTGVNFIFYYGTAFFQSAGITQPFLITVATGVVNVAMTIPGIIAVEKLGRRKFLLIGAAWMSFCQLIVGVVSITVDNKNGQNVLAGFSCLFIAGFASTWGPGAWVLIGELFPLKHRARGMSLATASNWWWNWVIAFVVPYITDAAYGNLQTKIAFIWFATSLIGCVWTFFFVPETRYHSLETLDEMFESGVKPWNTAKWVPSGAVTHGKEVGTAHHDDSSVDHPEKSAA
ncbi:hypothetical protein VKT23_010925 [Stygiomarasmius scandens]|uniref:Major facilitator superfamily (MFS) profile domain-containing protein n=1 Tax=Marasmiellus scandens TaxID=2682957 RepID=A0ABR1JD91_9AGAR